MNGATARGMFHAVIQVAAVYMYFLLFDQFGFLHQVQTCLDRPAAVQAVMAAMGVSGMVAGFLTARAFRSVPGARLLRITWAACAATALLTLVCRSLPALLIAGTVIGATTGAITVTVAATLADRVPRAWLGTCVGLGTGIAYACSNVPAVFEAGFPAQAGLAAGLSLFAGLGVCGSSSSAAGPLPTPARMPLWPWVVGLLALVWLDSAAFAMLQQDAQLKLWTWGPADHKGGLALAHLLGAVGAGRLVDRGFRFSLVAGTWLLFGAAFAVIPGGLPDAYRAALVYAVGISTYSVLLVAVPSLVNDADDMAARARSAAWLFGISGWIGSALGVGMAQQEGWLPTWFLMAAGGALAVAWVVLRAPRYRCAAPVFGRTAAMLALCAVGLCAAESRPPLERAADAVARGREVYRQEGCINCHSQYIRPRSPDVVNWGPYRPIDRTETPPFVGNRRQGPDLKNAGLRRSPAWHRVHLRNPRLVVSGSRMPSYAHLFDEPGTRGDDLAAYLSSLGRGHEAERLGIIGQWRPDGLADGLAAHGQALFVRHCVTCHGVEAAGDGPAAAYLNPPPRDLTVGAYAVAELDNPDDPLAITLARAIKFGLPGTSMPGHELLPDADIADLVHFVAAMQKSNLEPK